MTTCTIQCEVTEMNHQRHVLDLLWAQRVEGEAREANAWKQKCREKREMAWARMLIERGACGAAESWIQPMGKLHVLVLHGSVGATCSSRRCLALLQWRSKCGARHCSRWSTAAQQTAPSSAFPLLLSLPSPPSAFPLLLHLLLCFLLLLLLLICPLHSFWGFWKTQEKERKEQRRLLSDETHLCMTVSRFPAIVWRRTANVLQCLWNIDSLQGRKGSIWSWKRTSTLISFFS